MDNFAAPPSRSNLEGAFCGSNVSPSLLFLRLRIQEVERVADVDRSLPCDGRSILTTDPLMSRKTV